MSNQKKYCLIVLAVALGARILFLIWSYSGWYVAEQSGMSQLYFRQGYGIAAGYGYVSAVGPAHEHLVDLYDKITNENIRVTPEIAGELPPKGASPEMLHPPGFSLIIAGFNRLFGIQAELPVKILGVLLDTAAAILFYFLISSVFRPKVGFYAALIYAVFPPLVFASVCLMPVGYLTFFIILWLFLTFKAIESDGFKSILFLILSGFILGLGSCLRPDYSLLAGFSFLGLWIYTKKFSKSLIYAVLMQLVVFAVLFPWALRNHSISGRWIFTSTSVGGTLITGLGEFENPWGFGGSDVDRHREAREQGFESAWGWQADEYFRDVFIKSVKENPVGYLESVAKRLPLVIASPMGFGFNNPWKEKRMIEFRDDTGDRYTLLKKKFGYVLLAYSDRLFIAAIILLFHLITVAVFFVKHEDKGLLFFLIIPHIYSVASHIVTHIEPRFLLPSIFCLFIAPAYMFARGWQDKKSIPA